MKRTIIWFRKDFRLHDHPALWEAAKEGIVIPVYIWSDEEKLSYSKSEASFWWLYHSLASLDKGLQTHGLKLFIKDGDEFDALLEVMEEADAGAVYFNERYEPDERKKDSRIAAQLESIGKEVQTFHGHLLFTPDLLNKQGEPYKVFTSYWKRCMQEVVAQPFPVPEKMQGIDRELQTLPIDHIRTLAERPWNEKFHQYWEPGEQVAIGKWEQFSDDGIFYYGTERDLISSGSSSELSPYLAAGNISVKAIWYSAKRVYEETTEMTARQSINSFLKQLIWRDFAYHQLIHYPDIIRLPLRKQFAEFPWKGSNEQLTKWKVGQTGYPLVDAGMRELWETGVMHNRVRMVTASFLVKHLLIPWGKGYSWFEKTLLDFDTANNAMGWQWVTGCGIDCAPYFRIFNPFLQSEKFDPDGTYIRKWVPELSRLPVPYIHRPWEAPAKVLEDADIQIGVTYPPPIVDHAAARKRALLAYQEVKGK
ncbi:DNA photolyase family protein [Sporosarcina sp. ACRSL]|uniref:cryptochrome/photolyase family protein n=1 Tax=Sporosarcina sp. ACRSL TaxID=2918215 RepID=UPI001EF4CF20|nr:deoxyribodipyrimidine photo-lyase [Sporosarcina sp. ACRSL]MCG7343341.1 DNA photolyase family protein [Sporosarcina sp. ACRSL]